jgi:hypothetical protein
MILGVVGRGQINGPKLDEKNVQKEEEGKP